MLFYTSTLPLAGLLLSASLMTFGQARPKSAVAPAKTAHTATIAPVSTPKPDILIRRDGSQLEVLIAEITDQEIIYKRTNNPTGPSFRVKKTDFISVRYGATDETEQFQLASQPTTAVQSQPAPITAPQPTASPISPSAYVAPTGNVAFPTVRFGFIGGVQSTNYSGSFTGSTNAKTGIHAGIVVDRKAGKSVSTRVQIRYSSKGALVPASTASSSNDVTVSVAYIELPLDIHFSIPGRTGQFLVGGGIYSGYALSATAATATKSESLKIGTGSTDNIKPYDFGVRLSAWYDLPSGLTFNAFFQPGLSNINSGGSTSTLHNMSFGVSLGYFLPKK